MGKKPMGVIQTRLTTIDMEENKIEIYRSADGKVELNVKLEKDTVWLTQNQMAELFGVDRTSIVRHIRNIYKVEELDEISTCAKNAQVRIEGKRMIQRDIPFYNLDMIISVGYRVNSRKATTFRRWATSILKQYLIKGYAIDQCRLDHYDELKDVVRLMSRALTLQDKVSEGEYAGLFNVITDYVYALDTLDRYGEVWRKPMFCQRERRFVQKQHRADLSDVWWQRPLFFCRRKGCHAALSCSEESLVQRWQQTHCSHAILVVPEQ